MATGDITDIVRRMGSGPVNLLQVTSMMGQGPILRRDGELKDDRLEDTQDNDIDRQVRTSDGRKILEHRGNRQS